MELVEQSRLQELETQIERDKRAFYRIGMALVEIRDSRLYRENYATFEDYCRERWELDRRYAYRLMDSANVVNKLECGQLTTKPANEAQVRPLTKLETPEAQQEVWEKAVETAPEGKITAKHISKVVNQFKAKTTKKEVKQKTANAKAAINKQDIVAESFKRAYESFYWEVQSARLDNWKTTSKEASLYMVSLLKDLIEVK
jgi:hypothetical protein